MRSLSYSLVLFVISVTSFSQSLTEEMTGILNQIGKNIPSDQLFVQTDRNLYHAGDTIRFQAFIRDSRTGVFTTESNTLFVLLLNSDHATIDSARFRIDYAAASGWLKVPDDIAVGDYSILAFTSLDMNFSPKYALTTPVRIDKIVPAPNGAKSDGNNEAAPLSQIPSQLPQIDLRFLPEGGTFICGIKQRLAFNAVRSTGKCLEVSGKIMNQRDEEITEFRSTPYGPGVVEFTPLSGDSYFAVLDGEEFRGVKWSLPFADKSGVCMRVSNASDGMTDIILKGREISEKSWFLTVTINNVLVFSEDVRLDTLYRKRIRTDKVPSGTAFISLYDRELNPVAERLIFLNDYKNMNVEIGVSSPYVFHGDETELTVNTTDDKGNNISSIVSVAVIDSLTGFYNGSPVPEIVSAWLYDRELYNNLPFKIKSRGLGNIDDKSVDVLLMTYGWRSFHPKEITIDSSEKALVNYDFLKIINPGPPKKSRSDIKLISDANVDIITLPLNDKREAELLFDTLEAGIRQVMILPDKDPFRNSSPVKIVFPEHKEYIEEAKLLLPAKNYINPDLADTGDNHFNVKLGDIIVIEPVTIKPKVQPVKPEIYVDKHAKMYQSTGATTWYSKDFGPAYTLEDLLYRYNPYKLITTSMIAGVQGKQIFLRNTSPYIKGGHDLTQADGTKAFVVDERVLPALIVLDNTIIGDSYETVSEMPSSDIASVTFLRGVQGVPMYGTRANGGVVFITTVFGSGYTEDELSRMDGVRRNDDLLKEVRLFRTETEYYIPTREEVTSNPELQYRSTILWKADLLIDGSGPVTIKYPNNLVKGTAMVFVNGISFTNRVGSNRYSYKVN